MRFVNVIVMMMKGVVIMMVSIIAKTVYTYIHKCCHATWVVNMLKMLFKFVTLNASFT